MAALDKSARRMLEVARWIHLGQPVTYERIREQFKVQRNRAEEDIATVRQYFPVTEERSEGGRLVFRRAGIAEGPRGFTRAIAVQIGLKTAESLLRGTTYEEHTAVITEEMLSQVGRSSLNALTRLASALYCHVPESTANPERCEIIEEILEAILKQHTLRLDYIRQRDGSNQCYDVDPLALVVVRDRIQLVGRKRPDDFVRSFSLDGVLTCKRLRVVAPLPELVFNVAESFRHAFGGYIDFRPERVSLIVRGPWVHALRGRKVHQSQEVELLGSALRVRLTIGICPEFKSWLLGLVPNVTIEEPIELAEELRCMLEEGARAISVLPR